MPQWVYSRLFFSVTFVYLGVGVPAARECRQKALETFAAISFISSFAPRHISICFTAVLMENIAIDFPTKLRSYVSAFWYKFVTWVASPYFITATMRHDIYMFF